MRAFSDRRTLTILGLIFGLVLLVAANILSGAWFTAARVDLTEDRLYTLSDGTRQVLRQLDEPVTLRFYLSDRLVREVPAYGSYGTRVRDLLEEYVGASRGKIRLETYNPEPFTEVEDRAVAYGLQGVPVDQGGELVYFGLAASNTTDDEEVVAFFQPERERFLEYDLTRLIYKLARPAKRTVGLLSTLPIENDMMAQQRGQPESWMITEQIKQFFEVKTLERDLAEIPKDVDVLMLVHPAGLSDRTQYAIDQYVLRGGKVLAFVDPHSESAAFRAQAMGPRGMSMNLPPPASDLPKLFQSWGIKLADQVVVGDRRFARRVSAGPGTRVQAADYLAWISVQPEVMNRNDTVTAPLQGMNFGSAGIIDKAEGGKTTVEPLITSSVQSMRLGVDKVRGQPDIVGILRGFRNEGRALTIAARVSGPAETAFPDGPPKPPEPAADAPKPAEPAADAPKPADQVKQGTINVIVVADTDMLEDRFWVQVQQFFGQRIAVPSASNADFVVNALDNLTGSEALIGLRSRGISERPFALVRDIQQNAESQFRDKEKELQDKLRETEKKLSDLRSSNQGGQTILSPEQARTIEQFRGEIAQTRGDLRNVQRSLRQDIDRLQGWVRFVNIGLIPIVVAIFAIALGLWRLRRRRRAVDVARTQAAV